MDYNVRGRLGLQGLVPSAETDLQQEIDRARAAIAKCCTALDKYQVRARAQCLLVQQSHVHA